MSLCDEVREYVELVNGVYYQIQENRAPDGITHTAIELGPRGGPYKVNQYGRPNVEVQPPRKTSADRLVELHSDAKSSTRKIIPIVERAEIVNKLAAEPKNFRWKSQSWTEMVDSMEVYVTRKVIDGKFVITTERK